MASLLLICSCNRSHSLRYLYDYSVVQNATLFLLKLDIRNCHDYYSKYYGKIDCLYAQTATLEPPPHAPSLHRHAWLSLCSNAVLRRRAPPP